MAAEKLINVLVIGGGGREHALAWKIAQSLKVQTVYVAPGNAGTAQEAKIQNVDIKATDIEALLQFALGSDIAFTVVGPEDPLARGIVNTFRANSLQIWGPTHLAAQLESSKFFAKNFMVQHRIPTARFKAFYDSELAHQYVATQDVPIVIKADGLCAGKGAFVCMTHIDAHGAIEQVRKLGSAGDSIIIEDFIAGTEVSFQVMVSHGHVLQLATSQDNKRLKNDDEGPNTGGMGAISPAPFITPEMNDRIMREIIYPMVEGMAAEGIPYTGFLYAGLMIDAEGNPKVLEFNCRMGDPETQPIMMRLKSDLVEIMERAFAGELHKVPVEWDDRAALGVVLAAHGYPGNVCKGDKIEGVPSATADTRVFHAGTAVKEDGTLATSGGRVLCVTALGDGLEQAQDRAYLVANKIRFGGKQMRTDIGDTAIRYLRTAVTA